MSNEVGIPIFTPINLSDVFCVLERHKYRFLWKEAVKMKTLATTISCEQCFSVMKHSIHVNMKSDLMIASVVNKLQGGRKRKEI